MIVLPYRWINVFIFSLVIAAGLPNWAWAEIKLPKPSFTGNMSVEAAMVAKKSVRNFSSTPLTLGQISQLLWSANGNLAYDAVSGATTKVVPSAGGLYPLEIFLLSGKDTVTGLPAGVHQYKPATNSLETISSGDSRASLAQAALGQMWLARAPAIIVIAAAFGRTTSRYGQSRHPVRVYGSGQFKSEPLSPGSRPWASSRHCRRFRRRPCGRGNQTAERHKPSPYRGSGELIVKFNPSDCSLG